jgi:hypothetical protein
VQIEQSLLHNDREAFKNLVPHLRSELVNTPLRERATARAASLACDAARVVARMAHPTGLFVQINSGTSAQRTLLASQLAQALAPAFRRASVVTSCNPARLVRALLESTLVVSPDEVIPWRKSYGGVDIHWQPSLTITNNFEVAVATILSHLSQRTMRRLELQSLPSQRCECHSLVHTTVS